MSDDLWQRAVSFAARAHQGQQRKDEQTPYVAHPFRVAMTVRQIFGVADPVILSAAILHDVIEDTPADYDVLHAEFGEDVADIVAHLTKDMRRPEEEREAEYDRQLAAAGWQARLIKLADVYDNLCDSDSFAELQSTELRSKAIKKAQRAVEIAGAEPQLQTALMVVKALLERIAS